MTRRLADRYAASVRRWRGRARFLLWSGLGLYTFGFVLEWPFDVPFSGVVRAAGGLVVAAGTASMLLWLVDADEP
jgi:hypothetical protein